MTRPSSPRAASMYGAVDLSALASRTDRPSPASDAANKNQHTASQSPSAAEHIVDVTEEDFESEVLERSHRQVVVVDLWAPWCQPCTQLSPLLEKLAENSRGSWVLAKVNIEENQRIAQIFQARSIPMVIALAAGRPISAFQGVQPESVIAQWLADVLEESGAVIQSEDPVEKEDERLIAASDALGASDFETARQLFEDIRDHAPSEPEGAQKSAARRSQAEAGLREVAFLERVSAISPDVISIAQTEPDNITAQLDLADLEVAAGRAQQAFDRLIGIVRIQTDPVRTEVRKRIVELFELFDPADTVVKAARRKLASALF